MIRARQPAAASAAVAKRGLGMVRLVEVVLEPGKRAFPHIAMPAGASRLRCAAYPGVAGVRMPRELHHFRGRQRNDGGISSVD